MKRIFWMTSVAMLLLPTAVMAQDEQALKERIEKGRYVATAGDCMACHTSPKGKPFAGGYVIGSPMGGIVATNITPSNQYGIGNWTEEQFIKAVREGKAPHGYLYPAMPYTAYSGITDEDMHALWVYMREGVEAVDEAPSAVTNLSFPFNQRWLMAGWNILFAHGKPEKAEDVASGQPKRGEYLVKNLAHCQTCHSPRNVLMGEESSGFLAGGMVGGWEAPNITSDTVSGIGGWSNEELVAYLRDGAVHGKGQAAGPMAEAISYSLRHLTEDDLNAMAVYLKTVPPVRNKDQKVAAFGVTEAVPVKLGAVDAAIDRDPTAMTQGTSEDGQRLYMGACASCHQIDGQGTQDQFYPSLTRNTATGGMSAANLVMVIVEGLHRETNNGVVTMPAFGKELSDGQIAAVSNYVMQRFGNKDLTVTAAEVATLRAGGEKPWLLRATPWLMGGAIVVLLFIIGLVIAAFRRRRSA